MRWQRFLPVCLGVALAWVVGCRHDPSHPRLPLHPNHQAIVKALEFLRREVPAWSKDNACFSCHNNGDGARALFEARQHGWRVDRAVWQSTIDWSGHPDRWDHNRGEPGFNDARLANLQFAGAAQAAAASGIALPPDALVKATRRVARGQAPDGSWPIEPQNPAGSPATYGTTLATFLAWRLLARVNLPELAETQQRAEAWLRKSQPDSVVSAATLLWADHELAGHAGYPGRAGPLFPIAACQQLLEHAQAPDGGWGPYPDAPSEPYDTAVVVLAIRQRADWPGRLTALARAGPFLRRTQQADGSWPATTRPPGGESYAQRVSTTGWVVLALLALEESAAAP